MARPSTSESLRLASRSALTTASARREGVGGLGRGSDGGCNAACAGSAMMTASLTCWLPSAGVSSSTRIKASTITAPSRPAITGLRSTSRSLDRRRRSRPGAPRWPPPPRDRPAAHRDSRRARRLRAQPSQRRDAASARPARGKTPRRRAPRQRRRPMPSVTTGPVAGVRWAPTISSTPPETIRCADVAVPGKR